MSAPPTAVNGVERKAATARTPAPLHSILLVSVLASVVALALGATGAMGLWYRAQPAAGDPLQEGPSITTLAGQALTEAREVGAFVRKSAARDLSKVIDLLRSAEEETALGDEGNDGVTAPSNAGRLVPTESPARRDTSDDHCVECPAEAGSRRAGLAADSATSATLARPLPAVEGVFDRRDAEVIPPLMQRVRLRSGFHNGQSPPGTSDESGLVEVVVSVAGTVESAKFVTRPLNVHESMLLSAVKTWRFRPAMRNGRAIRYRLMVPISKARI